jgi:hypothetical protein
VGTGWCVRGLFRCIDERGEWVGRPEHHIWGWMQVGVVASVDDVVRVGGAKWSWAHTHPHLHFSPSPTNTLYVSADELRLPGIGRHLPAAGTFDTAHATRRLTCESARSPSEWCLPEAFHPRPARQPLTYHADPSRWSVAHGRTHLEVVNRGQEFVLDLDEYPAVHEWVAQVMAAA